jgi:hypothetical protein
MLDIAQCRRYEELALAHADGDVLIAARLIARLENLAALREAHLELSLGPTAPPSPGGYQQRVRVCNPRSPEEESAIIETLQACYRVATKPDRPGPMLRRAAVLERLVIELLLLRDVDPVREESRFRFSDWESACQDVIGQPNGPIEVYECKTDVLDLEQGQIDELERIRRRADLDGIDVLATLATLKTSATLADAIDVLELDVPAGFYQCTQESILALREGPPYSVL